MSNAQKPNVDAACRKLVMLAATGLDVTGLARDLVNHSTHGNANEVRAACLAVNAAEISWRSHRG